MVAVASADHLVRPGRSAAGEERAHQIADTFRKKYRTLLARFDAIQETVDNQRHWANADSLSADAAASPEVRRKAVRHARYEVQENNCFGKGLLLKHAMNVVGRTPVLRVRSGNRAWDDYVRKNWHSYSKRSKFGRKLRTMAVAKTCDGEAFAQIITNERLPHPVKADLRLIETEQVATPDLEPGAANRIDGIVFDRNGAPRAYHVLRQHPGSTDYVTGDPGEYDEVPAEEMLHWFREDRPNQLRGLPEVLPALPLFAQLRRFTLATIAAAETAAEYAGVMTSQSSSLDDGMGGDDPEPMDVIDIEMRSLLTLPKGWDIRQLQAEHPSTTFEMFQRVLLMQMSQCVLMPYNVAAGDSSNHNMASGRLDHKRYDAWVGCERHDLDGVLYWFIAAWYRELRLHAISSGDWQGEAPPAFDACEVDWFFDESDHSTDVNREAAGENTRLLNGSQTLARLYASKGLDWRAEFEQRAEEFGVSFEEYQQILRRGFERQFGGGSTQESEERDGASDQPGDQADGQTSNQPSGNRSTGNQPARAAA